jgi:hypothetical protein
MFEREEHWDEDDGREKGFERSPMQTSLFGDLVTSVSDTSFVLDDSWQGLPFLHFSAQP